MIALQVYLAGTVIAAVVFLSAAIVMSTEADSDHLGNFVGAVVCTVLWPYVVLQVAGNLARRP